MTKFDDLMERVTTDRAVIGVILTGSAARGMTPKPPTTPPNSTRSTDGTRENSHSPAPAACQQMSRKLG